MSTSPNLAELASRYGQYTVDAYLFVQESLRFAVERQPAAGEDEEPQHLTAMELVDGLLDLGTDRYGHFAHLVLRQWGIRRSEDVGAITFQLIECGVFGKRPQDRIEDFADGPEFAKVLRQRLCVKLAI